LDHLISRYESTADWQGQVLYHRQLVAAASALLATDPMVFPEIPFGPGVTKRRHFVHDNGFPNRLFMAQVSDPDRLLGFNYCEYVLANRLDKTSTPA